MLHGPEFVFGVLGTISINQPAPNVGQKERNRVSTNYPQGLPEPADPFVQPEPKKKRTALKAIGIVVGGFLGLIVIGSCATAMGGGVETAANPAPQVTVAPAKPTVAPTTKAAPSVDDQFWAAISDEYEESARADAIEIARKACILYGDSDVDTVLDGFAKKNTTDHASMLKAGAKFYCPEYESDVNDWYAQADKPAKTIPVRPKVTRGDENALESAQSYIDGQSFSKKGLAEQLDYEEYSKSEIAYAIMNVDADYMAEAVESAEGYLDSGSFSKSQLLDQLRYEGFTAKQAAHGVKEAY